jgi:hypothetical protein
MSHFEAKNFLTKLPNYVYIWYMADATLLGLMFIIIVGTIASIKKHFNY